MGLPDSSNIVGASRMCVDLREANKVVVTDSYPLPHIKEMLFLSRDCIFHYRFGECLLSVAIT